MFELTDNMTDYQPSMKLDFEQQRPLEVEEIYQRPLSYAREAGIDMPLTRMLTQQLTFLNNHS